MTERDLNILIQKVIREKLPTGSVVLRAKQNAPRPDADLWASVNVLTFVSEGWEEYFDENAPLQDLNRHHTAMIRSLISVNLFGLGARQWLTQVRMYFVQEKQRALFASEGVGIIRRTDVRDLSHIRHADFEERAQFDIEVYHHFEDTPEEVMGVEAVRIEGEVQEVPDLRYPIIIEGDTP
jgi:hypothetical protein